MRGSRCATVAASLALVAVIGCAQERGSAARRRTAVAGTAAGSAGHGDERSAPPTPSEPPPNPAAIAPRVWALASRVFVRARPDAASAEVGTLRVGGSVALRADAKPVPHPECANGFVPVQPEGWVCLDASVTRDAAHPLLAAGRGQDADFERAAPYAWGESLEAPLYRKIPTEREQHRFEPDLDLHLGRIAKLRAAEADGNAELAEKLRAKLRGADAQRAEGRAPSWLEGGAVSPGSELLTPGVARARVEIVPRRSTLSWTHEFEAGGRSWLVTPELLLAPKDRLLRQLASPFAGVHLEGAPLLPIAFFRGEARTRWRAAAGATAPAALVEPANSDDEAPDGERSSFTEQTLAARLVATDAKWPRLGWVALTGRAVRQDGRRYLETRDGGDYVLERDATVVSALPPRGLPLAPGEKWIDVSIFRGTLVAYEGERPVFATLISPGLHGYRRERGQPAKYTTPVGAFRIEWKHLSTTMSPDPRRRAYYLSDVPWTQFFHMPFALHAAYWHDRFGEPRSGGCVNLSVTDAKWLFEWTTPSLPDGWHGVRSGGGRGDGTWVRVR